MDPIEPDQKADHRSQHEFRSVDSSPKAFSTPVELWRAPCLLALFLLLSTAMLVAFESFPLFKIVFKAGDLVAAPTWGTETMPLRIFILCYMMSFGLFSHGKFTSRLTFVADMTITYLAICALVDVTALIYNVALGTKLHIGIIEILSGILGYAVYSFKLLERGNMPSRVPIERKRGLSRRVMQRFFLVIFLSGIITIFVDGAFVGFLASLRSVALLGGIGPGVFLFLPLVFILLYIIARIDTARQKNTGHTPALTIVIPAHNEEFIIERTIASIDVAAAEYAGQVSILVMDNNSTDSTSEVASLALANCQSAFGRVISEPKPGKSHALNAALAATQTEYVVRIDADTQIDPMSLGYAMHHMEDPTVGVVGGLPVPPGGGLFDRARMLELLVKHGFYSVGLTAVNSVVGVPGMFAAYRTELPRKLGGFVQGMNGEDTDMSLRIGELGYRLIVDPRLKYISEVPATYAHMREQRIRWFRSVFHVSARCRDLIYTTRSSLRGKVLLPYMLLNSALRAMMIPMILFGTLLLVLPDPYGRDLPWRAVLAVGVGAPAIISVLCAILNKSYKAILYIPEYLLFRLLRAYFTLESNLSITVKDHGQHLYAKAAMARPEGKDLRDA